MAQDILKRSPEEVKAAYGQAFSKLKQALEIDSRRAKQDSEFSLDDGAFVSFEYNSEEEEESLKIEVDDTATTNLLRFFLGKEGFRALPFTSPSLFIEGNEIKLNEVRINHPFVAPHIVTKEGQEMTLQLAGSILANWVTKSIEMKKLQPTPKILIKNSFREETEVEGPQDPDRDPID